MKRLKQDPRWPDAHVRLKKLYEERAPEGMSQKEFGELFAIGNQGMVWQYLNGWSPLNVEAAAKFARGLNCTIHDISPQMAKMLRSSILPVLGRAAALAFLALGLALVAPSHSYAGHFSRFAAWSAYYVKSSIAALLKLMRILYVRLRTSLCPITAGSQS